MRELKFRVWSKLGNEFVVENDFNDGAGITLDGKFSVCNQSFFGSVENSDDYIIQQYTGLKDKNGREIYEGDILENGFVNTYDESILTKYVVQWNSGETQSFYGEYAYNPTGFLLNKINSNVLVPIGLEFSFSAYGKEGVECSETFVIGNIFENPELLKE